VKKALPLLLLLLVAGGIWFWQSGRFVAPAGFIPDPNAPASMSENPDAEMVLDSGLIAITQLGESLKISTLRAREYPGSEFVIEETLSRGSNYQRYRVSYLSDGLKIYGLLTVPTGAQPESGWPVIVFNHGYIPPAQYRTTERYVSYVDYFARSGYIVFKSDYRGHGSSEGDARGGYGSPDYTIDVLNGVGSLKRRSDVNAQRIGMWGHSMGGYITSRAMVITQDVKVGVIWGGVVADYPQIFNSWRRGGSPRPTPSPSNNRNWRQVLTEQFGQPDGQNTFWQEISAYPYLSDTSGPIQLHHAKGDATVPWEFSQQLADALTAINKPTEIYLYEGDDHDITQNFSLAMRRSLEFFDQTLRP